MVEQTSGRSIEAPLVDLSCSAGPAASGNPAGVAILGATGSIGRQAARVISRHRDLFRPVLIAARSNVSGLAEVAAQLQPQIAHLANDRLSEKEIREAESLLRKAGFEGKFTTGEDALLAELGSADIDVVLNAIVGFSGIRATIATLEAGKRLALANKESLVAGGSLVAKALRQGGGEIVPVDSEHAALLQCLRGWGIPQVDTVYLTCSGGPFRGMTATDLESVGAEDALAHPTWRMGPKITVDSATLMNKGLEVIEAHWLFGLDYSSIQVVVHPQSVVHAIVAFRDGSSIAHLAEPDMENPILFALSYPERLTDNSGAIRWGSSIDLHFEAPDTKTFRCLELAYTAGRIGGGAPCVLNAANEVAVAAFLEGKLNFVEIPNVVESVLEELAGEIPTDLEALIALDNRARQEAMAAISGGRIHKNAKALP